MRLNTIEGIVNESKIENYVSVKTHTICIHNKF
jgi:hypothetical protein